MMRIVCVFTILLASPLTGWAQTTATLAGRVLDPSGGVLPGVVVTARQIETGLVRTATTDADGRYTLPTLPAGCVRDPRRARRVPPARAAGRDAHDRAKPWS